MKHIEFWDTLGNTLVTFYGDSSTALNHEGLILEYKPQMPERDVVEFKSITVDGGEQPASAFRNVQEQILIRLSSTSITATRNLLTTLNRMFQDAVMRQRDRTHKGIYLVFRPDTSETQYRSEVLNGYLEYSEDTLALEYDQNYFDVTVNVTRRYFWESTSLTQLNIGNSNGSSGTSGGNVLIWNHDDSDAGHDNFVTISENTVSGDLPAPAYLTIKDNATVSDPGGLPTIYAGLNWGDGYGSAATGFQHIYEAESGIGKSGTASASASGGNYVPLSITTSWTDVLGWTLTNTQLGYALGKYYYILLALTGAPAAGTEVKLRLYDDSSSIIYESTPVTLSSSTYLQEIGVLQIPTLLAGLTSLATMSLYITARRTSGATTINADFIQLTPTDGLRVLKPITGSYPPGTQMQIVDNMIDHFLYTLRDSDSFAYKRAQYYALGGDLMLLPGSEQQRLMFLMVRQDGVLDITKRMTIQLYYRPRRLFL